MHEETIFRPGDLIRILPNTLMTKVTLGWGVDASAESRPLLALLVGVAVPDRDPKDVFVFMNGTFYSVDKRAIVSLTHKWIGDEDGLELRR